MTCKYVARFVRPSVHFASALFVLGCGGTDSEFHATPRPESGPFDSAKDVQTWAMSASAVGVYARAYELLGVADGELSFGDPACPVVSDDGSTLTATGGCTDLGERPFKGSATVVRDNGAQTLTLDGWQDNDGTVVVRSTSDGARSFDADLVIEGVTTIHYSGTVEGGYEGPTLWNGGGRIERVTAAPLGGVDATTVDELVDDAVCSGQPLSGSTTLYTSGDTAVITYDGATDCDDQRNARLVVNGEDRGLVASIYCGVGVLGARGASGGPAFVLALIALASLRRRPTRATTVSAAPRSALPSRGFSL